MSFDPTFARTVMLPFVRAAYAVTADPTHEPQLPDGFTQTALLQADMNLVTELLKDLGDTTAPVLRAMTAPGSVYGLMGQNTQTQTAFVAFRGTLDLQEWLADFDAAAQPYRPLPNFGDVHVGFQAVYQTIRDSLRTGLPQACAGCKRLLVTGHSLGGALAVLAAPDVLSMPPGLEPQLITFGGPRVGLTNFVAMFNVKIESCFRVVNFLDIVPHVPLPSPLLPYADVGTLIPVDSGGPIDPATRHGLDAYDQGLKDYASQ